MNVNKFTCIITALLMAPGISWADQKEERRPNVIVILSDDMGYGDLSCQGTVDDIRAPNIDTLIFFLSDNGGYPGNGSFCTPYSDSKSQMLDGGIHLPYGWAIRKGDWMLVRNGWAKAKPALYNLSKDKAQKNDLSKSQDERYAEMLKMWQQWDKDNIKPGSLKN
jgi:hypothetical protein